VSTFLEAEVELDEERSEHGWVDTNALRRVGVKLIARVQSWCAAALLRRQRQIAFLTESGDVGGIGFFDALDNRGFAHKTMHATRLPCL
jgi:hypothetical protein